MKNVPESARSKVDMRIGFLASGRGSNLQAVIDACARGVIRAEPVLVISNNRDAEALARATRAGLAAVHLSSRTHPDPNALDTAVRDALSAHAVDLVVLAGYMKRLGPATLARFRGRVINIHPALLPKFGGPGMYGMQVHRAVLAAGEAESGATVHVVEGDYDRGPILARQSVAVHGDDRPETLAERVLAVEHALLVDVIARIADGRLRLNAFF
jgi:phosphoribosylglycinamide formyltransferase-1